MREALLPAIMATAMTVCFSTTETVRWKGICIKLSCLPAFAMATDGMKMRRVKGAGRVCPPVDGGDDMVAATMDRLQRM